MSEYNIVINGNNYTVKVKNIKDDAATVEVNGKEFNVKIKQQDNIPTPIKIEQKPIIPSTIEPNPVTIKPGTDVGLNLVKAPIPGTVLSILVKEGDAVKVGDVVVKMEAMKMENEIQASASGKITRIFVRQGQNIHEGENMVEIGS